MSVLSRLSILSAASAAACLSVLLAAGCGPRDSIRKLQSEDAVEALREARAAQREGRVDDARRLFEDLAIAQPANASARLELGILLQDLAGDPYGALGEYRAYLRLAPGSEKEEMVQDRIRGARDQIARRIATGDENARQPGSEEQAERISALELELRLARVAAEHAEADRAKAEEDVKRLQREVSSLNNKLDVFASVGDAPAPKTDLARSVEELPGEAAAPVSGGAAAGSVVSGGTWKVKRGDTLTRIAQKSYGDATRVADIRAANRDKIGPGDRLVEGVILVLP